MPVAVAAPPASDQSVASFPPPRDRRHELDAPWRLPLLFMISGLGTYYALGLRSAWPYARDRLGRLLLPLAFGMLAVIVPQVYVERISVGMPDRMSPRDFHGSYLDFYPHYFEGV